MEYDVSDSGSGDEIHMGELSKPDSNRASCITPSSLPRQMIPSGSSFLAVSNQLFQSYLRKHSHSHSRMCPLVNYW